MNVNEWKFYFLIDRILFHTFVNFNLKFCYKKYLIPSFEALDCFIEFFN